MGLCEQEPGAIYVRLKPCLDIIRELPPWWKAINTPRREIFLGVCAFLSDAAFSDVCFFHPGNFAVA
jgi:hypothetical protein